MLHAIKKISIEFGFYDQARRIARIIRKNEAVRYKTAKELYKDFLGSESRLCFDIGANIGELTEAMLAQGHTVVSFEPNDELAPELRARCGKYSQWSYCLSALGSSPGIATLHLRDFIGQASLKYDWGTGDICAIKSTAVITLEMAIEHFGEPSFIKIDTEGNDLDVLKSLHIPVDFLVFEFHLGGEGMRDASKCLEHLSTLADYECNLVDGKSMSFMFNEWILLNDLKKKFNDTSFQNIGVQATFGDIYCRRK